MVLGPTPPVDTSGSDGGKTCMGCDHFREENMKPYDGRQASGATCAKYMQNISLALEHDKCGPERYYWRPKFQMPKGL